jgi:MoaA/NifB/PqqE/SkfB family radical SAM enzyme
MPIVTRGESGQLILPAPFLERRRIPTDAEYWLDERDGDLILHPRRPDVRKLYIEPTTRCNLACHTCIRHCWADAPADMAAETFARLDASMDGLPQLQRVIFTGFGEPLVHPRLLDMVETVRRRDLAVSIGTNGLLLDGETARALVQLGVDRLVVSLDGVRPATYQEIRGPAMADVLDNIRRLNEVKRQLGSLTPALGIEFVALRSNIAELADLTALAARLGAARVLVSNVLPYTEEMRQEILYGCEPRPPLNAGGWPVRADCLWAQDIVRCP